MWVLSLRVSESCKPLQEGTPGMFLGLDWGCWWVSQCGYSARGYQSLANHFKSVQQVCFWVLNGVVGRYPSVGTQPVGIRVSQTTSREYIRYASGSCVGLLVGIPVWVLSPRVSESRKPLQEGTPGMFLGLEWGCWWVSQCGYAASGYQSLANHFKRVNQVCFWVLSAVVGGYPSVGTQPVGIRVSQTTSRGYTRYVSGS